MFVKSLLRDSDATASAGGLVITTLLLTKLSGTYVEQYSREGTYAALKKLASHVPPSPKTDQNLQVCTMVMRNLNHYVTYTNGVALTCAWRVVVVAK
jgi:hypothetical protein